MQAKIESFLRDTITSFRRIDVWDSYPTLALLCENAEGALQGVLAFPDSIWEYTNHPHQALRILERVIGEIGMPPLPSRWTLVGLVLVSEGYGVDGDARPAGYWDTHRIADDPAGFEYVSALAVDIEGTAYGHDYRRFADESHPHVAVTGRLVDGMRRLLEAMRRSPRVTP